MADLKLTLANTNYTFNFVNTEIPESIAIGGMQDLAVHKLVGGGRTVDALGEQPRQLSWSGWFLGPDALTRAQYLDAMRKSGQQFTLTFHQLSYTVVIAEFHADFQRFYQLPYSLTLEVVQDLNKAPVQQPPAVDDAIAQDAIAAANLTGALAANTAVLANTLTQKLSTLQSAMKAISSFATATQSALNTVLGPINDFRSATQALLAQMNNLVQNVTTLGGLLPNNPVASNAANLLNQANAMNSLPQLVQLDGVLGRLQKNVSNASSGNASLVVAGGDLYNIAAQQYGDATAWTTIARANGLSDPQLQGVQTLTIPTKPDTSGGVLNG